MSYHSTYLLFHISLGAAALVAYLVIVYYAVPNFVESDKHAMATSYTNYGFTAFGFMLTLGSLLAQRYDATSTTPTPTKKNVSEGFNLSAVHGLGGQRHKKRR